MTTINLKDFYYWYTQDQFTLKTPEITILRQEPQQYATFSIASYILHAKIFTIFLLIIIIANLIE